MDYRGDVAVQHPRRSEGRRAPLPPVGLEHELARGPVIDALEARFDTPLTVIVAGAGFGKTTALGQAIRANSAAPRGLDAWVSCQPGDEDDQRLADAMVAAIDPSAQTAGRAIDRVVAALASVAPTDVCLIVDDAHELPDGSAGAQLLAELARSLPPHAHLVIASRHPVPVPLARRRAAGEVVEIGSDLLAFTRSEIATLAGLLGRAETEAGDVGGWPALVRLALAVPASASREFLWEEVVAGLDPSSRAGLLAAAMLGAGSPAEVAAVAGAEVDCVELARAVPLIRLADNDRLQVHPLWAEAVDRLFPVAEVARVQRRVLELLAERGETLRLGSTALRWHDNELLAVACTRLVADNLGALPLATANHWLAEMPMAARRSAGAHLLRMAVRHADKSDGGGWDGELDELEARFIEQRDPTGQATCLALAATAAHGRNDLLRLLAIIERIRATPGWSNQPSLRFFDATFNAAATALTGDLGSALQAARAVDLDQVPPTVGELAVQLQAVLLLLAGRADEAVEVAQPLRRSSNRFVQAIPSLLRWASGDPFEYLAASPIDPPAPLATPHRLQASAHLAVVAASLGDRRLSAATTSEIESATIGCSDARDDALAATALAAGRLLDHDEPGARSLLAQHLVRHPSADARIDAHLRHNLALGYVLNDELRCRWEDAVVGPSHGRVRAVARALLQARAGALDERTQLESSAVIVSALPLPWSIELGVRAVQASSPDGRRLLEDLVSWLPTPARRELEHLAVHGAETCRGSAADLLAELADPDSPPLMIDVLGPLRLRRGTTAVDDGALRRSRVRTLLSLLVLRRRLRRDRICDLLWPDFEPPAAAQNLRVTLSHLRRLVETPGPPGQVPSPARIRSDGEWIELLGPPLVLTDLDEARRHLRDAELASERGDRALLAAGLSAAVGLWRDDSLPDLVTVDDLAGEVGQIEGQLLESCLRIGELELVAGRFDAALRYAERARAASPWNEPAHRLALACQLQRRNRTDLETAAGITRAMLDDLGVEPEATTLMLLRQADRQLGLG